MFHCFWSYLNCLVKIATISHWQNFDWWVQNVALVDKWLVCWNVPPINFCLHATSHQYISKNWFEIEQKTWTKPVSHSQCLLPFKVTLCSLFLRKHFIARADRHCKKWKNNVAVKVDPYPMCHKLFGTQPNEQNKSDQRGKSFEETNFVIKVFSSQIFPTFFHVWLTNGMAENFLSRFAEAGNQ